MSQFRPSRGAPVASMMEDREGLTDDRVLYPRTASRPAARRAEQQTRPENARRRGAERLVSEPPARPGPLTPGSNPSVVGSVIAADMWDPLLSLKALVAYSSLSERMLRSLLRAKDNPLPHFRVGSRILVRKSDFDRWITIYREPATTADQIVDRLLADLDTARKPTHACRTL